MVYKIYFLCADCLISWTYTGPYFYTREARADQLNLSAWTSIARMIWTGPYYIHMCTAHGTLFSCTKGSLFRLD